MVILDDFNDTIKGGRPNILILSLQMLVNFFI